MPFLSRQDIDPKIRRPHEGKRREKLREALSNPALSEEQRVGVKRELAQIGRPKKYSANLPPKPGAVSFGPDPERLRALKKVELIQVARRAGVAVSGTKEDIIGRLVRGAR